MSNETPERSDLSFMGDPGVLFVFELLLLVMNSRPGLRALELTIDAYFIFSFM